MKKFLIILFLFFAYFSIQAQQGVDQNPQGWFNVLDWGLKPDSSTDNTAKLQALLNFVPAGSTIFFPPGKYLTANHVYQATRAIKWKFANYDHALNNSETFPITSGIVHTNSSDTCIIIGNTAYGTVFEDAAIVYTGGSSATSTSRGVFFGTAQNARTNYSQFLNFGIPAEVKNGGQYFFEHTNFYNGSVCNIQLADSLNPDNGDGIIDKCTFATITAASAGVNHINYISGGGLHVINCKFNSGGGFNAGSVLNMTSFTGTVDFFFQDNSCEGFNGYGIVSNKSSYGAQNGVITGNEFFPSGSSPMIYLDGTSSSTGIYNIAIDANNFTGNGSDTAIYLNGSATTLTAVSVGLSNVYKTVGQKVVRGAGVVYNSNVGISFPDAIISSETPSSLKFTLDGSYRNHLITLTGNDTIFIANGIFGEWIQIQMTQDGTGGRIPILFTGGSNLIQGSVLTITFPNGTAGTTAIVQGYINSSGQLTVENIATQFTTGSVLFASPWLNQNNSNLFWDNSDAWLGVGNKVPIGIITTANSTVSSQHNGIQSMWNGAAADPATIDIMKSRGTFGSPTSVISTDYMGALNFWGYGTSYYKRVVSIGTYVNGTVSASYVPADLYFALDTVAGGTYLYDVYADNAVALTIKHNSHNFIFGNSKLDSNAQIQLSPSTTTIANMRFSLNGADVSSPTNGMLWYNSNTHKLNMQDNGTTQNILGQVGQAMASGQTTLVSGTKAISIAGVTTSSKAFVALVTPSGVTLTIQYQAVCTSNTVTLQANVAAGTINVSDGSTLNYLIIF